MDLSVASTTATYPPVQSYPAQTGGRGNGGAATQDYAAVLDSKGQATADQTRLSTEEAQKALQEAARKKDPSPPSTEVAQVHGFAFEYEGTRQVMKVNNEKGVLIYQVPSKGQLALIEVEDDSRQRSQLLRLTA
ncbi:MAG: hypothetical protein PHR30_10615 [Gallionellaceae bacterium]|nr:hypothetical protein [Gallionellaceae bacterium]MDD5365782.1 hypothetical protein [Gallionellaceae bacterium]